MSLPLCGVQKCCTTCVITSFTPVTTPTHLTGFPSNIIKTISVSMPWSGGCSSWSSGSYLCRLASFDGTIETWERAYTGDGISLVITQRSGWSSGSAARILSVVYSNGSNTLTLTNNAVFPSGVDDWSVDDSTGCDRIEPCIYSVSSGTSSIIAICRRVSSLGSLTAQSTLNLPPGFVGPVNVTSYTLSSHTAIGDGWASNLVFNASGGHSARVYNPPSGGQYAQWTHNATPFAQSGFSNVLLTGAFDAFSTNLTSPGFLSGSMQVSL